MMEQIFQPFATRMLVIGFIINLVGGIWLTFASYAADPRLARWSRFRPYFSLRLLIEHHDKCLKPFILQFVGSLFFIPFILNFLRVFNALYRNMK